MATPSGHSSATVDTFEAAGEGGGGVGVKAGGRVYPYILEPIYACMPPETLKPLQEPWQVESPVLEPPRKTSRLIVKESLGLAENYRFLCGSTRTHYELGSS